MKTLRNIFLVAVLVGAVGGCAGLMVRWRPHPGFEELAPTEKVQIFEIKPDRPFIELGSIASESLSERTAINRIIKKSKEIGADAFIILSREREELAIIVRGVAIKWKTEK